jgi:acetyl-CoA carboxylase carboxyl transferase subunit alpha
LTARHPQRPQTRDYIERICDSFVELHGDRGFADDRAIVSGLAVIAGRKCVLIGQHKGRDVHERAKCNFGYSHPEGYRKALHKMQLAEKFGVPVVCLIDTPGAAAAVGAEERGVSEAIARNLMLMSGLKVPVICIVIGEGGSGGALGIGVGDVLLMQEYAYFSVITPEGCASILWRDANKKEDAAEALKLTGKSLMELGVVDGIIPEPLGGAHRTPETAAGFVKEAIVEQMDHMAKINLDELLERRYKKLRAKGKFLVKAAE